MVYLSRFTRKHILFSLFFILLFSSATQAVTSNHDEITFAEAAKYTVKIRTQITFPFYDDVKSSSIGTGFLINRDKGLILTNAHVVGRSRSKINIMFKGHDYYKAKKLYVDPILDLAIIQYPTKHIPKEAKEAKLKCDSSTISGLTVGAYGHPWNLSFTATRGIISGQPYLSYADWIQTDAPINSGNSGGPLINLNTGKVVGISSAMLSKGETEGLNFALPIEYACKVVDLYNAGKNPSPMNLGVSFFERKGTKPLKVAKVINAKISALKSGDIILGVDGVKMKMMNPFHLLHALRGRTGKVKINILREDKELVISLNVEHIPNVLNRKGIYFSGMIITPNKFDDKSNGVYNNAWVVNFVDSGSTAETELIESWDYLLKIDNKPLGKFNDVFKYIKSKRSKGEDITLMVRRVSSGMRKNNDYHEFSFPVEDEKVIKVQSN